MTEQGELEIKHDDQYVYRAPRIAQKPYKYPKLRSKKELPGKEPALSAPHMRDIFYADFEQFAAIPGAKLIVQGKRRHIYIDRGSNVLGVAHLDSVKPASHFWMNNKYLASPVIDDRLGVWAMLQGVPSLGYYPDVLLTDGEEIGQSTAADFKPAKEYNWLFSFDRMGDDVACYDYLDEAWRKELGKYDLKAVYGMGSDIAYMYGLGIKAMNIGCGMYNYHEESAYCKLDELRAQMVRFRKFCDANWNTRFPHTHVARNLWKREYDDGVEWGPMWARNNLKSSEEKDGLIADSLLLHLEYLGLELGEWWAQHAYSVRHEAHQTHCTSCDAYFTFKDANYSFTVRKMLCHACFIIEMVTRKVILPEDFADFEDTVARKKQKLLESIVVVEGD